VRALEAALTKSVQVAVHHVFRRVDKPSLVDRAALVHPTMLESKASALAPPSKAEALDSIANAPVVSDQYGWRARQCRTIIAGLYSPDR